MFVQPSRIGPADGRFFFRVGGCGSEKRADDTRPAEGVVNSRRTGLATRPRSRLPGQLTVRLPRLLRLFDNYTDAIFAICLRVSRWPRFFALGIRPLELVRAAFSENCPLGPLARRAHADHAPEGKPRRKTLGPGERNAAVRRAGNGVTNVGGGFREPAITHFARQFETRGTGPETPGVAHRFVERTPFSRCDRYASDAGQETVASIGRPSVFFSPARQPGSWRLLMSEISLLL